MAFNYFLSLAGYAGDTQSQLHPGWFDISSVQFGDAAGNAQGGPPSLSDISITRPVGHDSSKIWLACLTGMHIPKASIALTHVETGIDSVRIDLNDVFVSAYSLGGGGDLPTESFSLAFAQITYTVKAQKADGTYTTESFTYHK